MKGFRQLSLQEQQSPQNNKSLILIDKDNVLQCQINPQNIVCSICHNILWNPIMCGIKNGCHNSFCKECINEWVKNYVKKFPQIQVIPCPNCKNHFVESPPHPLLVSILKKIVVKCLNAQNGCKQSVLYSEIQNHINKTCEYILTQCSGCKKDILTKQLQRHQNECPKFIVQCLQCNARISKCNYLQTHIEKRLQQIEQQEQAQAIPKIDLREYTRSYSCYDYQINTSYPAKLTQLQKKLIQNTKYMTKFQKLTTKILNGQFLQLSIDYYTRFTQNFLFPEPKLIKSSYNPTKQKYDFLHFYINNEIYLNSITNVKWEIRLQRMKGNVLLGFCNNMNLQSIDLIVNKYGQIKLKKRNDNKYKLLKKDQNFTFKEGDTIEFRCIGIQDKFVIQNKRQKCELIIDRNYLEYFYMEGNKKNGQNFNFVQNQENGVHYTECVIYPFYSFDTEGDQMIFL